MRSGQDHNHFRLCTLIFGEVNAMVRMHLRTIASLPEVNLCIGLSRSSESELKLALDEMRLNACLHYIEDSQLATDILGHFNLEPHTSYAYTHKHFAVINLFKWVFLLNVYDNHPTTTHFVFTDFDVVWLSNPPMSDFQAIPESSGVSTQLDSLSEKRAVHCTGIIFLRNCVNSKTFIEEVFEMQKKQVFSGNLNYYDQVAFNDFVNLKDLPHSFGFVSPEHYVIGSDALKLSISRGHYLRNGVVAFHANYIVGHAKKYEMMDALLAAYRGGARSRINFFQRALRWKIVFLVNILSNSIKSKLNRT